MKKIIFILILFLSCYLIYTLTINNKLSYLSLGDALSKDNTYTFYLKEYLESKNKLLSYNTGVSNILLKNSVSFVLKPHIVSIFKLFIFTPLILILLFVGFHQNSF